MPRCTVALLLLAAAPAALATPLPNYAQVAVQPNFAGGSGPYSQVVQQPGIVEASGSATGGGNSSGDASVHVEYGLVRISADTLVSINSLARGYIRDTFTITAPGVAIHTPGTLTYTVTTAGSQSATSGASAASWTLQTILGGGAAQLTKSGTLYAPQFGPPAYRGDPFGTYTATIPFQFGDSITMNLQMTGSSQAGNGQGTGAASFDMPRALTWGGLSNLTANGAPITIFTVTSDSGTDWSHPFASCSADFNGDGDIGTDADIEAFFACLAGNCCATCGSADFNHDGDLGTDADIESFFRVLGGGSC